VSTAIGAAAAVFAVAASKLFMLIDIARLPTHVLCGAARMPNAINRLRVIPAVSRAVCRTLYCLCYLTVHTCLPAACIPHTCRTAQFLAAGAALPGFLPDLYSGDAQFNPELPAKTASFGKTTLLDRLTVTAYNQGTKAFQDRYAKSTKDVYTGHAAHAFDAATVVLASYFADAKGGKPVATVSTVTPLKTSLVGELHVSCHQLGAVTQTWVTS
jgi:hypothetical protein